MRRHIPILSSCWFSSGASATAQALNQEMASLAEKLSKALVAQGFKSVAAVDFTDLEGQSTESRSSSIGKAHGSHCVDRGSSDGGPSPHQEHSRGT